jgi:hypothetical protein
MESMIPRRPHRVVPELESVRLILTARLFMKAAGSNIGLNITADNNMKVLQRHHVDVEVWPTQNIKELRDQLSADYRRKDSRPITHVVISAPGWIHPEHLADLAHVWPNIEFCVLNHSGLTYFQIDKFGMRNNKMLMDYQLPRHNMRVAANNSRTAAWMSEALGSQVVLLTNLYEPHSFVEPTGYRVDHDPLRVGSFGAGRPHKNQLAAAEAAVVLARRRRVRLEFYVNSRRPDGGERIIESRDELFDGLAGTKKFEIPWLPWPKFRQVVRTMDIMLSPSFDETFCVVVADGIAEGVPSVVGTAMEWAPKYWQVSDTHDPFAIAHAAMALLHDPHAMHDGRQALRRYVDQGIDRWIRYLTRQPEIRY